MIRLSIRTKLLASISLVIIVSIIASGLFAYYYFTRILKEQAIKDDKIKVQLTSLQFKYIQEDIQKFSYSVIVDNEIQDTVKLCYNSSGSLNNVARGYKISKRLESFCLLRDYIQSAAIIFFDSTVYYSDYPYDGQSFKENIQEDWYREYKESKDDIYFSKPHVIEGLNTKYNVISYIMPLRNIEEPDIIFGELVLNIYLDYFNNILLPANSDFDDFIWLDAKNNILYEKGTLPDFFDLKHLPGITQLDGEADKTVVEEKPGGYMVLDGSMKNGWKLAAFTSKSRLFARIGYLFYSLLIFIFASLLFAAVVILPVIRGITSPISKLTHAMKLVSSGKLDTNLNIKSGDEIEVLSNGFNQMVSDLKKNIENSLKQESVKKQMEFDLLLAKINPHFIYNTLNSVVYLARKYKNYDVVTIVNSFISILQDAVKIGDDSIFTTIKQEVEIVNHYMCIHEYQHKDRFELIWDVDETLLQQLIPKTLIQPLVENALFHGLYPKKEKGIITVSIKQEGNDLAIIVEDNGVGVEKELINRLMSGYEQVNSRTKLRSIGIPNIKDRINYLYGSGYGISITGEHNIGTRVAVTLPLDVKSLQS